MAQLELETIESKTLIKKETNKLDLDEIYSSVTSMKKRAIIALSLTFLSLGLLVDNLGTASYQKEAQQITKSIFFETIENQTLTEVGNGLWKKLNTLDLNPIIKISNNDLLVFSIRNQGEISIKRKQTLLDEVFIVEATNLSSSLKNSLLSNIKDGKAPGTNVRYVLEYFTKDSLFFYIAKRQVFLMPKIPLQIDLPKKELKSNLENKNIKISPNSANELKDNAFIQNNVKNK
jgi:hypothetical protein